MKGESVSRAGACGAHCSAPKRASGCAHSQTLGSAQSHGGGALWVGTGLPDPAGTSSMPASDYPLAWV